MVGHFIVACLLIVQQVLNLSGEVNVWPSQCWTQSLGPVSQCIRERQKHFIWSLIMAEISLINSLLPV